MRALQTYCLLNYTRLAVLQHGMQQKGCLIANECHWVTDGMVLRRYRGTFSPTVAVAVSG